MRRASFTALIAAATLASCAAGLSAEAASASTQAASAKNWLIGLCRFTSEEETGSKSILLDTLPLLIVSDLKTLPERITPEADAEEMAEAKSLRSRFAAGAELAAKLDARAASFFVYTTDDLAWRNGVEAANKEAVAAAKKLDDILAKDSAALQAPPPASPTALAVKLWADHGSGKLIEAPSSDLAQAAKAAGVDLLVTGRLSFNSGYAALSLSGYDASLGRRVFTWKSYCAVDDPAPLAREMAHKLEAWSAGRPMARVDIEVEPASAEISVNGRALAGGSRVVYAYEAAELEIRAQAAGYRSLATGIAVEMGDRKTAELKLEASAEGSATVRVNPPDANLSLDSMPRGKAPTSIELDGQRSFLEASAPNYESKIAIIPASGYPEVSIDLRPSDGLGPKGRIEAAKDRFYSAFGLFALSIPLTALSTGVYNQYLDAYSRSGDGGIYSSGVSSANVLDGCIVLCCVTAAYAIFRLVQYLGAAN